MNFIINFTSDINEVLRRHEVLRLKIYEEYKSRVISLSKIQFYIFLDIEKLAIWYLFTII